MGKIDQRKLHDHMIRTNLSRLSDETLAKIWDSIEDEVEENIDSELKDADSV